MSAELYTASGNNGTLQGTTVGGSKPLHRFIKAQPNIIGVTVLVLGSCFLIVFTAVMENSVIHIWTAIPPVFLQAVLFIICGILYIVTEHKPTKKTVTISLALSILSVLGSCWTILHISPSLVHDHFHFRHYDIEDNSTETALWSSYNVAMGVAVEAVFLFYSIVGAVIFIVMSVFAGAALRSTKSQAIIMMTTTAAETPAE